MPPHSTVLVCAGTWDKVEIFSRKACSHDLSPRGNDYRSVVYKEAQGSRGLQTKQSYPWCPACGNHHSTSLEVQFSSHRTGTLFCDQPDAVLTPAQVGGDTKSKDTLGRDMKLSASSMRFSNKLPHRLRPLRREKILLAFSFFSSTEAHIF